MLVRASWQTSVMVVAGLLAAWLVLRRLPSRRARVLTSFCREFMLVFSLIALWQYVGGYVHNQVGGAFENAYGVWHLEQALHLPSEVWVQRLVLPSPHVVWAMNLFYESVHFNSMWMFLIWLWWYHRGHFPRARTVIALTTLGCLLVQSTPVAPPRMLDDLGFVDTALVYGQSVYGANGSGVANQLAAMPSVHVAWAALLAFYGFRLCRNPWRWLFVMHCAVTVLVVVATANHWWMDGIVAVGIMGLAVLVRGLYEQGLAAVAFRRSTPFPIDHARLPPRSRTSTTPITQSSHVDHALPDP